MSHSSDDARRERINDEIVASDTVKVLVCDEPGYDDYMGRKEILHVSVGGTLIRTDERYGSELATLSEAWEMLEAAEERAQNQLVSAQLNLVACAEIRKRLEKVREFPAERLPRPTSPFAFLLKRIREQDEV